MNIEAYEAVYKKWEDKYNGMRNYENHEHFSHVACGLLSLMSANLSFMSDSDLSGLRSERLTRKRFLESRRLLKIYINLMENNGEFARKERTNIGYFRDAPVGAKDYVKYAQEYLEIQ